jgi:hypothetical protein
MSDLDKTFFDQVREAARISRKHSKLNLVSQLRTALEHCYEVTADPAKHGRYLTAQDREIIREVLKNSAHPSDDPNHVHPFDCGYTVTGHIHNCDCKPNGRHELPPPTNQKGQDGN